jgi:hypothetical protein
VQVDADRLDREPQGRATHHERDEHDDRDREDEAERQAEELTVGEGAEGRVLGVRVLPAGDDA